jgi:hypothetical protein
LTGGGCCGRPALISTLTALLSTLTALIFRQTVSDSPCPCSESIWSGLSLFGTSFCTFSYVRDCSCT